MFFFSVVAIFTSTQQQKRSSTGAQNIVVRDSNLGPVSQRNFTSFLHKLKVCLDLFVSHGSNKSIETTNLKRSLLYGQKATIVDY